MSAFSALWSREHRWFSALGGVMTAVCAAGCVANDSNAVPPPPPTVCGASSRGAGSKQPMLVDVDPNQTMAATPGQGVGVFTEYQTGGHWHVWWTCDTSQTGLECSFQVNVSVASGAIANLASQGLGSGDQLSQPTAQSVNAASTTLAGADGVTFDTPLDSQGAVPVITLEAKVNGEECGAFLFFVQDGKVNGGAGAVTDPLMLEPATP